MLSQKTRYTIRALMHLADKYQQGLVPLTDIAEAQNIPAKFLTVILSEMSRAGLVVSQRGRDGGYELALPPVDISYGDIIRISRGSLALVPCASRFAHALQGFSAVRQSLSGNGEALLFRAGQGD